VDSGCSHTQHMPCLPRMSNIKATVISPSDIPSGQITD